MKTAKSTILIKKKRRRKMGYYHTDSWKIAYADFMTSMMAFFLVMWILSISSPQELSRIADYFRTPLKTSLNEGINSSDVTNPIPGGGQDVIYQDGDTAVEQTIQLPDSEPERFKKLQKDLEQLIMNDPRLQDVKSNLLIDLMEDGLQIQIIDGESRPMFGTGSAVIDKNMRKILHILAPVLNDYPNKISLAGHTDSTLYAKGGYGYSNWELSADRANSSRRTLISGGLKEYKIIRVVGMASTVPLENNPAAAANRRISILVLNKEREAAIIHENQRPQLTKESREKSSQLKNS
ncbi:flagellar motor protein MotB [Arsenophonus sp.]|uniref:flagellar motor protein MotB n=1 Tax=Arsenophonus sp. TaxID=1872640 RepID=UPI00387A47AB